MACITWSPFSSLMLACSKPSLSDGTHTIFFAAQSACATPLLRKSFSKKRYLLSSAAGSAMFEISPSVVEAGTQGVAAGSLAGRSEAVELTSSSSLVTGSASGGLMALGLTSDLGLTSALLTGQKSNSNMHFYQTSVRILPVSLKPQFKSTNVYFQKNPT